MDLEKSGRGAIERMVEAYGFTTRQALCDKLGVTKSSLATRYMRDSFPSDWVIQCALETGASLKWLATGKGSHFEARRADVIEIDNKKLIDGKLFDAGFIIFDKVFIPQDLTAPVVLTDNSVTYLADLNFSEVKDGRWLINIDGNISIKELIRVPGGKIRIEGGKFSFECGLDEIIVIAHIKSITTKA